MSKNNYKLPLVVGALLILAVMVTPAWAASVPPLVFSVSTGGTTADATCDEICAWLNDYHGYDFVSCDTLAKFDSGDLVDPKTIDPFTIYDFGYKVEDGKREVVSFNWTSTATCGGTLIVVVKDGNSGSNVYVYENPPNADDYLTTPFDGANGISNIKFCCAYENGVPVPEFPTLALPATLIVGMLGVVFAVRRKNE